jgi:hypothetical protein
MEEKKKKPSADDALELTDLWLNEWIEVLMYGRYPVDPDDMPGRIDYPEAALPHIWHPMDRHDWVRLTTRLIRLVDDKKGDSIPLRRFRHRLRNNSGTRVYELEVMEDAMLIVEQLADTLPGIVDPLDRPPYKADEWVSLPQLQRERGEVLSSIWHRLDSYKAIVAGGRAPELDMKKSKRTHFYRAGELATRKSMDGEPIINPDWVDLGEGAR